MKKISSEQIRVGIVGAGGIGLCHSNVYRSIPDVCVVGVADSRLENAAKIADEHGAKAYSSINELLANESLDVLDVCVPTYLHPEMVLMAAKHKIHVLCEKPIALNRKSARKMIDACKSNGVLFMIAHVIRFWPEYAHLKKVFDEKTFGELKEAYFSRISSRPKWVWENWMMDVDKSGGAPLDLHIHDADYIMHLLGKPWSVTSYGIEQGNDSYIRTQYQYDDMVIGAEGGWYNAMIPFRMSFRAVFEHAALEYRDNCLTVYPADGEAQKVIFEETLVGNSGINVSTNDAYLNEIRYFIDCVKNGEQPDRMTPESSYQSLDLVLKELKSVKIGKTVKL